MKPVKNLFVYLFLAAGFVAGITSALKAEAVFMNDGSIIEGKIVKDTNKSISIKPQAGPVQVIQRKDFLRILYSDDYKKKVYIYKMDNTLVEGYVVHEDNANYAVRETLTSNKEILIPKESVNSISKKKVESVVIEKKVIVEKIVEVDKSSRNEKKYGDMSEEEKKNLPFSKYFYLDIALYFGFASLNYANGIFLMSPGFKISITNSYSSFILFGFTIDGENLFLDRYFGGSYNFQAMFGLNWNINNKFFIQPYILAGFSYMLLFGSGTQQQNFYGAGVFNVGVKFPIRTGKDWFITPFIEIKENVAIKQLDRTIFIVGVGISF